MPEKKLDFDKEKYPPLNLPQISAKVRSTGGQLQIFDPIRKKYLVLTPEEWVRQHYIAFLISELKVPSGLIKLEYQIEYGSVTKRPDIAVMHPDGNIWLIVECKAPQIAITEKTFHQAATYFSVERPKQMALTNGLNHVYCKLDEQKNKLFFIKSLQEFNLYE